MRDWLFRWRFVSRCVASCIGDAVRLVVEGTRLAMQMAFPAEEPAGPSVAPEPDAASDVSSETIDVILLHDSRILPGQVHDYMVHDTDATRLAAWLYLARGFGRAAEHGQT